LDTRGRCDLVATAKEAFSEKSREYASQWEQIKSVLDAQVAEGIIMKLQQNGFHAIKLASFTPINTVYGKYGDYFRMDKGLVRRVIVCEQLQPYPSRN